MVKKRKVTKASSGPSSSKNQKLSPMKSKSQLGSVILRKDPELTVTFHDDSVIATEADVIALSACKKLRINSDIYKELVKRGKDSTVKEAFKEARSNMAPGSVHGGTVVIVDMGTTGLPYKNLLLVVEPDNFHIAMACKGLFETVHNLGLSSLATNGLGCGTERMDSKKAALKLKDAINYHVDSGKLDKLKKVGIFDINPLVINDFMAVFGSKLDVPESQTADDPSITRFVPPDQVTDDACVICLCELADKSDFVVAIKKCDHMFHNKCFDSYVNQATVKRCPTCQVFFAFPEGNMPRGSTMKHHVVNDVNTSLEGGQGYISIRYTVPSGIQEATHLRPGLPFGGTSRHAFLPNTPEGHKVLKLLKKAFDCRLTFTVGDSITSGAQNVAVWNNIHHKTSLHGGSANFGYPDSDYLNRVTEELRAAGVTEDMINE